MTDINYYENEKYKILLYQNKFKDKFIFEIENDEIIIKRVDANIGWGQNLNIIVRNKILETDQIINVGDSDYNIKNISFIREEPNIKNYYENAKYKIFYISKLFNDVFKIEYDEISSILTIQRTDANEGWGQDLYLKYIEIGTKKEKLIHVGSSRLNILNIKLNISHIKFNDIKNIFESENYKIIIYNQKYADQFLIKFYEENQTIYIKRIDSKDGWGENIMLKFIKKNINNIENYDEESITNFHIIFIGSSLTNELYKKIDLSVRKYYVGLTTIPSRIILPEFKENIINFLENHNNYIENLFITIPRKYRRFTEIVPDEIIKELQRISKVIIIFDTDYGPGTKYLGPLINYYHVLENNILVIIDDDRKYSKNLIRNFKIGYESYPKIIFSSGYWKGYFHKNYKNMNEDFLNIELYQENNDKNFFHGQGLGGFFGFAMKVDNLYDFIKYNMSIINRIPKSLYHDEGIILGYIKYKKEIIIYLKHKGCELIKNEMIDALCTSNLVNRGNIEKEILQLTNLEKII